MPGGLAIPMTNNLNLHEMYFNNDPHELNKIYFVGVEQADRPLGRWSNLLGEDVLPFAARRFLNSSRPLSSS